MNLDEVENAIRAWLLPTMPVGGSVILANQNSPQPLLPYATMSIGGAVPRGAFDSVSSNYDAGRAPGAEVELQVQSQEEFTLSVQLYTVAANGNNGAPAVLRRALMSLALPSVRSAFQDAGIAFITAEPVINVAELIEATMNGHASCDLRFRTSDTVSEFTGYISDVAWSDNTTP